MGQQGAKSDKKFYESIFVVRVLSEDEPVDNLSIPRMYEAISFGDCVGQVRSAHQEITLTQASRMLESFGSEPAFFGLDYVEPSETVDSHKDNRDELQELQVQELQELLAADRVRHQAPAAIAVGADRSQARGERQG